MKHIYSIVSITLLIAGGTLLSTKAQAQSPTTVTNNNTCAVVQDFNTNNGNFTAPSIYSDQYDYEFNWTGAGPGGMMVSSSQVIGAPYETSLISPIYQNTALDGTAIVGFSYSAPANTLYRIRVIRPNLVSGGADILATTSQGPPVFGTTNNWAVLPAASGNICLQLNDADIHTGQNLRFEFTFYVTSTASRVNFDNFALNSIAAAPLPVTFMGLVANRIDNGVNVKWDVAEEVDVKEYQLEKSTNGTTFSSVKTISALHKKVYGFTDPNAKAPEVFYRVKSVDLDGKTKYSGIIRLVNGNSFSSTIKAYPSPAQNQLTLQHSKLGANARLTISTMDGKVLKVVSPANGASNTMVDVTGLTTGMYLLRLDNGNGKIETTTFVKQ